MLAAAMVTAQEVWVVDFAQRKEHKMKYYGWTKRVLSVVLVLVMVVTLVPRPEALNSNQDLEEEIAAKARATEASEILIAHFVHSGYYTDYPDYYAGCYIGDDYLFHVRLHASHTDVIPMLNALFGEYVDVVTYEYSEYSWNELDEYVDGMAHDLTELGYSVTNWGVDDFTGNVYIGVLREDIAEVNALIDDQQTYALGDDMPTVMIEEGNYIVPAASVQPGGSMGNITLGAYGYYNGEKAIVTCGHGGHKNNYSFSFGNVSGTYAVQQYADNQNGDYAIGIINTDVSLKHAFGAGEGAITGVAYSPVVGSYIRKYGKESGLMTGEVVKTNDTCQFIAGQTGQIFMYVNGMTKVRAISGTTTEGDSGGPCITYTNGFCGVFSGYETEGGIMFFYFTPNSLLSAAGFTVYTAHRVSSWPTYDANWHYGYCSACSGVVKEGHGAYWDETTIPYCTRCGYVA